MGGLGTLASLMLSFVWICGFSKCEGTIDICPSPHFPDYSFYQQWECFNVSGLNSWNAFMIGYSANVSRSVLTSLGLTPLFSLNEERITGDMAKRVMNLHLIGDAYDSYFQFMFWLESVKTKIENIHLNTEEPCKSFNGTLFKIVLKEAGYHGLLKLKKKWRTGDSYFETFLAHIPMKVYSVIAENVRSGTSMNFTGLDDMYLSDLDDMYLSDLENTVTMKIEETLRKLKIFSQFSESTWSSTGVSTSSFVHTSLRVCKEDQPLPIYPGSMFSDLTNTLVNTSNDIFKYAKSILNQPIIDYSSPGLYSPEIGYPINKSKEYGAIVSTTTAYLEDTTTGGVETNGRTSSEPETGEPGETEYRAMYYQSHDQPFLLPLGSNEFNVQLKFMAVRPGFGGATVDDVKVTLANRRSFRDEATIMMTVIAITPGIITVGASTDASATWSFTMAIKGQPILNGKSEDPLKIDLRVEHSAPTCLVHNFTDSGNAIEFVFNVPVNVTRTEGGDCADFFEEISSLGEDATCDMKTPRLLFVTIGEGDNLIIPGDVMVFKPNTINPARQMFYRSLSTKGYSIDPPHNPQGLSFTIDGPTRINKCGTYKLRAEQIAGHGGRPVTYQWQLPQQLQTSLESNGLKDEHGSPELSINAAQLQPGMYSVSLTIINFLQQNQTRAHDITVLDEIKPVLQIKPLNIIPARVRAFSRVKLEAVVTFSFGDNCQSNENIPTYEWSGPESVIIPDELRNDRILVLPPNTLPVGETVPITVTVGFAETAGNTDVSEMIQLSTVTSPIVAKISGANKLTLGPDVIVSLNGSQSHDPNGRDSEPLNFQWACTLSSTHESCDSNLDSSLTSSYLSIKSSRFTVAGTYSISLTVSNDATEASAFVTLIIEENVVPVISIKTLNERTKFRDDESIYIQANIESISNVTTALREANDRLNPDVWERGSLVRKENSNKQITHVKIPSDQTTPGAQYTIEVIATDDNDRSGLATFSFEIYRPITQCNVKATNYKEMSEITITATGCVADADLQPLTYQPVFALPLEDGGYKKIVLGGSTTDSTQTVIASPINYDQDEVLVGFKICDASSTCVDGLTAIPYETTSGLSQTEQQDFITNSIDKELEKGDVATAFRNAINIANLQKKTLLQNRRRRRNAEFSFTFEGNLDSVFLVVNGQNLNVNDKDAETQLEMLARKQAEVFLRVAPVDVNEGALMSDLSPQMLTSMFTEDEIDGVLNTTRRTLDKATDERSSYDKDTMERMLTTLKMSEENLKSTGSETKERRNNMRNLRETALKQAGRDLNIDEHVTLNISGTQMFVAYSLPKDNVALTDGATHLVNIKLGTSLSNRFGYDWCNDFKSGTCVGIKVMVTQMESLEKKINKCSDIFSITLLHPVTDAVQQLSDRQLEDSIEIEMAKKKELEEGQSCVCKYWNEETNQLDSEGVTSAITSNGNLVCKSNHVGIFVSVDQNMRKEEGNDKPQPQESGLGVGVYILFGVLFLVILALAISGIIVKAKQKQKVTPERNIPEDKEVSDD